MPAPDTVSALGLIAADVGGTYARLGWVDTVEQGRPLLREFRKYACSAYPDLAAILRDFCSEMASEDGWPERPRAVLAVAGLRDGDVVINANLPWPVSLTQIRQASGLADLALINDFEALAHGIVHADPARMRCLCASEQPQHWPLLVLGPGTGFGAALCLEGAASRVLTTEVGHAALAPGNARELEVLTLLMQRWPHVDNERVFSGPGLINLYQCLCQLHGVQPRWSMPAQVIEAAEAGGDAQAEETLEVFCGWLGSLVGDLAITFGAKTVYLAGGVPVHLEGFLRKGQFLQRYLNKSLMSNVLKQVPVWLVEDGQLGVIGAVAWWLAHCNGSGADRN